MQTAPANRQIAIDKARAEGRSALIGYLPAGYPTVEDTIAAGIALARNGADLIEIGIPYSDPVMDGPVIQAATTEALANGFAVRQVFDVVAGITGQTDAAVLVMTYWNPVVRMGVDEFSRRLAEAGGAGLITPDLIPDEAAEWMEASDKYGLDRVFLVAPSSSPERMKRTVEASRGFVYAVSIMGVTGARSSVSSAAEGRRGRGQGRRRRTRLRGPRGLERRAGGGNRRVRRRRDRGHRPGVRHPGRRSGRRGAASPKTSAPD